MRATRKNTLTRRTFLNHAACGALLSTAFPSLIPASAVGANDTARPGDIVTLGCIGTGQRGSMVLNHFLAQKDCQVVAVCDVKEEARAETKTLVDKKYGNTKCSEFEDFRDLLARKDIDAVLIASTDNWHVLHALAAVRSGKDLYVEKPLGLTLAESQFLRKEVRKRNRVFQFGTQQRSDRKFRIACELVQNGHIGKLKRINVWAPGSASGGSMKEVPPPPGLNYDLWLGPAEFRPHTQDLTHNTTWWHVSDFAIGFIAGWGIHPMDIALWGAGSLASGKVKVGGTGSFPTQGLCNDATTWDIGFNFDNGLVMQFSGVNDGIFPHEAEWRSRYGNLQTHGTAFEGTNGWICVDRARIATSPEELIEIDTNSLDKKLLRSSDHVKSFLEAVRTRQPTVSSIDSAVLSDAFCHVANVAIRLNRNLVYDVKSEEVVGDSDATERLALREMRAPWNTYLRG